MQKITPCLWFNFNAEEAAAHYLEVFPNSRIVETTYYGDAMPELKGRVLTLVFEIEGMQILALNGGPQFRFTEAISLAVNCETQAEVDRLWEALTAGGGEHGRCGWLKDRFGVSWQLVPRRLIEMFKDPDAARAARAMQAMMTMRKLDIAAVERAFAG